MPDRRSDAEAYAKFYLYNVSGTGIESLRNEYDVIVV